MADEFGGGELSFPNCPASAAGSSAAPVTDDDCRPGAGAVGVGQRNCEAEIGMDDNVIKFKPKQQPKAPRKLSRWQRKIVIVVFVCAVFGVIYVKNRLTGQA